MIILQNRLNVILQKSNFFKFTFKEVTFYGIVMFNDWVTEVLFIYEESLIYLSHAFYYWYIFAWINKGFIVLVIL